MTVNAQHPLVLNVQDGAEVVLGYMEARYDGHTTYYVLDHDRTPQAVYELMYEAHGHKPPDDHVYEAVHDVLESLARMGPDEDAHDVVRDAAEDVSVYTSDRLAWLSSRLDRVDYVDEARDLYGEGSLDEMIAAGWALERLEVGERVLRVLNDWVESSDR